MSWITIAADTAELLAGLLACLYCCLGARPGLSADARRQDLGRRYPELDRELDLIWQRYGQ